MSIEREPLRKKTPSQIEASIYGGRAISALSLNMQQARRNDLLRPEDRKSLAQIAIEKLGITRVGRRRSVRSNKPPRRETYQGG